MSKNFVSNSDAQALMQAIEAKKLTVSDTMPAASPALFGNTRLYIGSDTASLSKGGVYQCQALEVTPAGSEDPQSEGWYIYNSVDDEYELTTDTTVVAGTTYYTIEWKNISRAEVDLSHYKKIWGGSTAAWEQLTDAEKEEYDYEFFDDDQSEYSLEIVDNVTEGIMNPVTSNAVAKKISNDSVSWEQNNALGAKNFVHITAISKTVDGITYTINNDGTISASGTATALAVLDIETTDTGLPKKSGNYILSDGLETHSADQYTTLTIVDNNDVVHYEYACTKDGDNDAFTIDASNIKKMYLAVCVGNGATVSNLIFKPMVRLASIKDDTFETYSKTNQELTADSVDWDSNSILGAHNLYNMKCPSRTNAGITFTVNDDGTISISGSSTADAYLFSLDSTTFDQYSTLLHKGTYTVSGSIDNNNIYFAVLTNASGSIERVVTCSTSKEKTFILSEDAKVVIQAYVTSGQNITTPVTLKPMIRLKSDNNSDFQPYAMTNRELTKDVINLNKITAPFDSNATISTLREALNTSNSKVTFNASSRYVLGHVEIINLVFDMSSADNGDVIFTGLGASFDTTYFRPTDANGINIFRDTNGNVLIQYAASGSFSIRGQLISILS